MNKKFFWILAPVCWGVFIAVIGMAVMLLWNFVIPDLFGLPCISFLQALALFVLCRLLFGGIGSNIRRVAHPRRPSHRHWQHLSPAERKEFVRKMRNLDNGTEPETED